MEQPFFCTYGYNTTVGDNFFLNVNDKLMDSGKITIGNNVFIAPSVCIIMEEHTMDVRQRLEGLYRRHHPARRDDRREQRHWRGQCRHQGHSAQQPGRRQPVQGDPHNIAGVISLYFSRTLEQERTMAMHGPLLF